MKPSRQQRRRVRACGGYTATDADEEFAETFRFNLVEVATWSDYR
jgi:hypothetical protein